MRGALRRLAATTRPARAVPPFVAVTGDRLDCLRELRTRPEAQEFRSPASAWGPHRGAVVGLDATGIRTRKDLVAALRDVEVRCAVLCARLPRLEHLFLMVDEPGALPMEVALRVCDKVARRIHTRLEQSRGRSIVVTAVLVGECDDAGRLAERVVDRSRQAESLDTGIALPWCEIARSPIGEVAVNEYL